MMQSRDGIKKSIWQDIPSTSPMGTGLSLDGRVWDVMIVGAGITGVSTALELTRAGLNCLLLDAHDVGFGTTGGTTAHFNTFLDHDHATLASDFGIEAITLLTKGLRSALDLVSRNVKDLGIDCSHSWEDGHVFSSTKSETDKLGEIYTAAKKAGVDLEWSDTLPIDRPFQKVLTYKDQAQLHPLRYLNGLMQEYLKLGGTFRNNCRVHGVKEEDPLLVDTSQGEMRAHKLIYATHIPPGINILHLRCAPYRSYVVSASVAPEASFRGLVYDMEDPYHYYRCQVMHDGHRLIVGGEDHKTGHDSDGEERFRKLSEHVHEHFENVRITHSWSSQYYQTTDGLPYIGTLPGHGENVLVATGMSGNGMTLGTLSAIAFRELLTKGSSPLIDLFDPKRISPVAGSKAFIKENIDVAAHMISKPFLAEKVNDLNDITNGEGKLIKYEGTQMGVFRDEDGQFHIIDPICPHAKCTVKWNNAECSWDCPCHGSRFSIDGTMITGPSTHDLRKG